MRSTASLGWTRAVAAVLLIGAVIVPMYVSPQGGDHFRLPKELLLHATAIIATAIAAIGATLRRIPLSRDLLHPLRVPVAIAGAGLAWSALTTLTSTIRPQSVQALIWTASLVAIFVIAAYVFRFVPAQYVIGAIFVAGIANGTLLLLQAAEIYNPWYFPENTYLRYKKIAFLGNPDDIGVFLAAPALLAVALTLSVRRRLRFLYAAIAVFLTAAIVATETLTAIGAFLVAAPLVFLVWKPRLTRVLPLFLVLVGAIVLFGPTRDRVFGVAQAVRSGRWGSAVSGRLLPFGAAWEMFTERPLLGLGPGAYKYHYMREYIEMREEKPQFFTAARTIPVNFRETHNDHLQALAEVGFPGYALVLAALASLGLRTWRTPRNGSETSVVARHLAAPFAALTAIIMLAQFPFQLAGTAYTYLIIAAACWAWSTEARDA